MNKLYLEEAKELAQKAGAFLKTSFYKKHHIETKSHMNDWVTESDKASEDLICTHLKKQFPHHSFLCEESGKSTGDQDFTWIIDPLDGTVNFAKQIPFFSVSIALLHQNRIQVGVVYSPMTDELFYASRGQGAFLNHKKIHVTDQKELKKSIGATGFPYLVQKNVGSCIRPIENLLRQGVALRRLGSAALDLAYVAAGRFDLFFEFHLEPWDFAAGALLVEEACGTISDYQGSCLNWTHPSSLCATNGFLQKQMLEEVLV